MGLRDLFSRGEDKTEEPTEAGSSTDYSEMLEAAKTEARTSIETIPAPDRSKISEIVSRIATEFPSEASDEQELGSRANKILDRERSVAEGLQQLSENSRGRNYDKSAIAEKAGRFFGKEAEEFLPWAVGADHNTARNGESGTSELGRREKALETTDTILAAIGTALERKGAAGETDPGVPLGTLDGTSAETMVDGLWLVQSLAGEGAPNTDHRPLEARRLINALHSKRFKEGAAEASSVIPIGVGTEAVVTSVGSEDAPRVEISIRQDDAEGGSPYR